MYNRQQDRCGRVKNYRGNGANPLLVPLDTDVEWDFEAHGFGLWCCGCWQNNDFVVCTLLSNTVLLSVSALIRVHI